MAKSTASNATGDSSRGALAVQEKGGQQRQHRPRRIDEPGIDRRRPLQPEIAQAVANGEPEQPQRQQEAPAMENDLALLQDLGGGERDDRDKGDGPAHQAESEGRHHAGKRAADDGVARP
jgi:hypothetical protein